jgi:Tfp pilus assembly protein PilW
LISSPSERLRLRDEGGFTLVELLVGLMAGMVVASGLFTVLDVTLEQTTRTFSRVDATQRARTALERIETSMHSACVQNRVVPIRQGSTSTAVNFFSAYGSGVELTPVYHTIAYNSGNATLTDTTYASVTGDAPNWLPSGATSTTTLLTNVAAVPGVNVFRYFSAGPTGKTELTAPLDEPESEKTTDVQMTLVVKPAGGSNEDANLVPNTVTNSVSLRLSPTPNPGTPNQDFNPCE